MIVHVKFNLISLIVNLIYFVLCLQFHMACNSCYKTPLS